MFGISADIWGVCLVIVRWRCSSLSNFSCAWTIFCSMVPKMSHPWFLLLIYNCSEYMCSIISKFKWFFFICKGTITRPTWISWTTKTWLLNTLMDTLDHLQIGYDVFRQTTQTWFMYCTSNLYMIGVFTGLCTEALLLALPRRIKTIDCF